MSCARFYPFPASWLSQPYVYHWEKCEKYFELGFVANQEFPRQNTMLKQKYVLCQTACLLEQKVFFHLMKHISLFHSFKNPAKPNGCACDLAIFFSILITCPVRIYKQLCHQAHTISKNEQPKHHGEIHSCKISKKNVSSKLYHIKNSKTREQTL